LIGIYIRVSSATQVKEGYSLTAQKERLTAYCKAQGWENYKFYVEKGLSAKDTKRPVYQNLMKHVQEGKINTVLVYKLDRIMRSIGELDNMLKILEKHECAFKSATEPFDTSNATGKLFIYLVGALAQWEIELNSERISMVLEEKVANEGIWPGAHPYPFDKDPKTKRLVPNEEKTKTTLKMIELLKKGYSTVRIADYLTKTNNDKAKWHHNAVIRILRNPALCGDIKWNDKVYKNKHPSIIERDEFEKIQQILEDRGRTRHRKVKSTYLFQGKLSCPSCKKPLNVNRFFRKNKDGTTYQNATYRCPPCAKSRNFYRAVSETKVLDALYKYMQTVDIKYDKNIEIKKETPDYIKRLEVIERKRQKYQRAWANDLMTDYEFKKMMDETRDIYDELKEKAKNYKEPKPINVQELKNIIITFNENFKGLTNDEKRIFISTFIRRINFKLIPQKPLDPRNKEGRPLIKITNVEFY